MKRLSDKKLYNLLETLVSNFKEFLEVLGDCGIQDKTFLVKPLFRAIKALVKESSR